MKKQLKCNQLEWHDLRINERDLPAIDEEYRDERLSKYVLVLFDKTIDDLRTTMFSNVAYYDYVNESWVDSAGNIVWREVIGWSYLPEINL